KVKKPKDDGSNDKGGSGDSDDNNGSGSGNTGDHGHTGDHNNTDGNKGTQGSGGTDVNNGHGKNHIGKGSHTGTDDADSHASGSHSNKTGGKIPITFTHMYSWLLVGLIPVLIGLVVYRYRGRRKGRKA